MKSTASMNKKRREMDKNPRVEFGDVELDPAEFDSKHAKFRVSMWLDGDLVEEIRKRAANDGMKYQPWINRALRDLLMGENSIERRLKALEEAVFKKRAS